MKFVSQIWSEILTRSKNRKIMENLLKWTFLNFSPDFDENFEMESYLTKYALMALFVQRQCRTTSCGRVPPLLFLVSISVQTSSITWCPSFNVSLQFWCKFCSYSALKSKPQQWRACISLFSSFFFWNTQSPPHEPLQLIRPRKISTRNAIYSVPGRHDGAVGRTGQRR